MKIRTLLMMLLSVAIVASCGGNKNEEAQQPAPEPAVEETTTDASAVETTEAQTEDAVEETAAEETTTEETTAAATGLANGDHKTPIRGRIVSIDGAAIGKPWVNKAKAKALVAAGRTLAFIPEADKDHIYFVFEENGMIASQKLAKYAANEYIGIIGTVQTKGNIKSIIARKIESM